MTLDLDGILQLIGTSLASQESVPAAFGLLALAGGDGWHAGLTAAAIGGDTDTIAAMAGAVAGATGWTPPPDAVATVERVNGLRFASVADALLALRTAA